MKTDTEYQKHISYIRSFLKTDAPKFSQLYLILNPSGNSNFFYFGQSSNAIRRFEGLRINAIELAIRFYAPDAEIVITEECYIQYRNVVSWFKRRGNKVFFFKSEKNTLYYQM